MWCACEKYMGRLCPVVLIAAFDLADVAGKMAPGWFPGLTSDFLTPPVLVCLSTARVLFVPAFLLVTRRHGPRVLYDNEAPCVALTLALGGGKGVHGDFFDFFF